MVDQTLLGATEKKKLDELDTLSYGHWSIGAEGVRKLDDLLPPPLVKKSSLLLPHLAENEKKFFELVTTGNVAVVEKFFEDNANFRVNCVNFQGVSALNIAVENRNELMVDLLLKQKNIDVGDNALRAVRNNDPEILVMLLEKLQEISPGLEFVGCTHSSEFPDHITPIILACQCGHYEIIELLIDRGHRIDKPHPPDCRCGECKVKYADEDSLHSESYRLDLYRAVCNPAYISHSSTDPILSAFTLSQELRKCSRVSPQFRTSYEELAQEISTFAVELIGCCRTTEEMNMVLRQPGGVEASVHFLYPRLILALDFKQKEFVAHPNTQQLLETAWHGEWHDWRYKNSITRLFIAFSRIFLLPIMCLMCLLMPKHTMVKLWRAPINKFITHNASYFVFLILIFLESNQDKVGQKRSPPDSGLEPIIILYVIGYVWNNVRLCAIQGPKRYFSNLWNVFDLITCAHFLITFILWYASYEDAKKKGDVDLERKYWHHLDPLLLAEGFFALGVIMAYYKLLYLCRINYYLGPLQISIGKMHADVARYLTMFAIVVLAFSIGLCRFYSYYDGMVQVDDASGMQTSQVSSFTSFSDALKTFFWGLFTMSPLEAADVVIENLPSEIQNSTIINKHTFTEAVGYICYAIFEILTVIILLNMLIATTSSTFSRVTDNADVELTFGKTLFYMEYMVQTTLPSPFNLIPTASGLGAVQEWIVVFNKNLPDRKAHCSPFHCCFLQYEVDRNLQENYPIVMAQLIQRYFREKDSNVNTENDIEIIKQELGELKQLINERRGI